MFCDVWNGAFGCKATICLMALYLSEKNFSDICSQNDENVQAQLYTHLSLVVPTHFYLHWHR